MYVLGTAFQEGGLFLDGIKYYLSYFVNNGKKSCDEATEAVIVLSFG